MAYNIIFYFTDQQRWDTCGCFGQPLNITPNLDQLAREGVKFDNAFSPNRCAAPAAPVPDGQIPHRDGLLPQQHHAARQCQDPGQLHRGGGLRDRLHRQVAPGQRRRAGKEAHHRHTITAIPKELRGGYTGFWRAADVLEFTSHGYDGYVFDENNNRIDFKGYRADCITDMALEFFDQYDGKKPFFMTISQIEPHHQNDHNHYEGPEGSKEKYKNFVLPHDLEVLKGNAAEEYPDYLGQCASLDRNLGRLVDRLKKEGSTTTPSSSSPPTTAPTSRPATPTATSTATTTTSAPATMAPSTCPVIAGGLQGGRGGGGAGLHREPAQDHSGPGRRRRGDAMIGENLLDVVEKRTDNRPNQVFAQISESRVGRCVRTPDYLYSVYAPGVNGGEAAASDTYADDFLYDLKADPGS